MAAVGLGACALLVAPPASAAAQDVEMLGRRYGTRPPDVYFEQLARDPDAYRFTRGRAGRIRAASGAGAPAGGAEGAPRLSFGPRDGPVTGDFTIPVLLGLFSDGLEQGPFPVDEIEAAYFAPTPPAGQPGTVRTYYEEVSGGRVVLDGAVMDWRKVDLTRAEVTRGDGALSPAELGEGGIGNFVFQLIEEHVAAAQELDWGAFDNDGPDGVPNSGDDDGYVDALAVMHPTYGAECDGSPSVIWSHKWSLRGAVDTVFVTPSPRTGGGSIRIDDYFVQPAVSCELVDGAEVLNEIGVFTHEAGHAFGLPDLYDTRYLHSGVGNWDLMATGTWGCDNPVFGSSDDPEGPSPASPCHMGAWSKAVLGWVDVVTLDAGVDHETFTIPPVASSETVYRVDAQDGSGEYYLLETRTRGGSGGHAFDEHLPAEGLLVWQIDPALVAARWPSNAVNASDRMGVRLQQADGRDDLGRSTLNRGDAGDPFPYDAGENDVFHAGSTPASRSWQGTATGLTVLGIERSAGGVDLTLLTRFTDVTIEATESDGTQGLFSVAGSPARPSGHVFSLAPFDSVTVEAAAGELLEPGVRRPFERWTDGARSRSRGLDVPLEDLLLTALYEGREVELGVTASGGENGIAPGTFHSIPFSADLWFPEGTSVSLEARPRTGFGFEGWTGALAGQPNPATVDMETPIAGGASFDIVYAVATSDLELVAAMPQDLALDAVNGTAPLTWSVVGGSLPAGLSVRSSGRITGAAMETGDFEVRVEARDGIGLHAGGTVRITVRPPAIDPARAAARLVNGRDGITLHEERFLDRHGNANGRYDLGDLRAWVQAGARAGDGS